MPKSVRAPIDICTGHGCFPPRNNISGSNNILINGFQAHRVTDPWASHCCVASETKLHTTLGKLPIWVVHILHKVGIPLGVTSKKGSLEICSRVYKTYKTKKVTQLIEIELENGAIFRVTPDHKILLADGVTYKKAEEITYADDL